jgi:FIMAH domain-containing protein
MTGTTKQKFFKGGVQHMHRQYRRVLIFVILLLSSLTFLSALGISTADAQSQPQGTAVTPYQIALEQTINARRAAGLPVPTVTFSNQGNVAQLLSAPAQGTGATTATATTLVHFDGPEAAGYSVWPAMIVSDNRPAGSPGKVATGDYTETYRNAIQAQIPDFWSRYQFGHEPRQIAVTENYALTYSTTSSFSAQTLSSGSVLSAQLLSTGTSNEDILMGFLYSGPHLDYTISGTLEDPIFGFDIGSFSAGFRFDWALGLRLPAHVDLSGPSLMVQGDSYNFSSSLSPRDWSSSDYSNSGAAAENGNEFVARFNFSAFVEGSLFGVDLCSGCNISFNADESQSFTTPFGSGASFPISPISIPIYSIPDNPILNFSASLKIQPNIGSTNITADWHAVPGSDCSGSGTVTYTEPGVPVSFGPVKACDLGPTDKAQVELDNFHYFFNQFTIDLIAALHFDVFGIFSTDPSTTIASFDLSSITGNLSVPDNVECDFLFNCGRAGPDNSIIATSDVVDQDAPTTTIALAGTVGNHGWYKSDVQVTLTAVDNPTNCGVGVLKTEYSFDGINFSTYISPFMLTTEGLTTVYFRSTDKENNVEVTQSQLVQIDKTPPVITGTAAPPPNGNGWNNTNVTVHFDATDAVSGIDTVTPDTILGSDGANQSVLGTAVDMAGNSASFNVTGINIDQTPPSLTINSPQAITYANTDTPTVDWTASDALSGIASETGTFDGAPVTNGQTLDLLLVAPGFHTVQVDVVDMADNSTSASVSFFVTTDINGLMAALGHMCGLGMVGNHGICNSLMVKLQHVKDAMDKGQCNVAENLLDAFMHELDAQNGKGVSSDAYAVLLTGAQFVKDNLSSTCQNAASSQSGSNVTPASTVGDTGQSASGSNGAGNGSGNGNGNGAGNGSGNGNGNSGGSNAGGNGNGNAGGNGKGRG